MKRFYALVLTAFLSIFLVAAVNADTSEPSARKDTPKGVQNAMKVMQHRVEHNKQIKKHKDERNRRMQDAQQQTQANKSNALKGRK
jgi:hypothetical protein